VIRLVVVDDQPLVRMGLRVLVDDEPDIDLVGEAADGAAGLDLIRRERPDVALLDIRMPVLDGLAALGAIAGDQALSATRVVMLTTFELDEYVFEALRLGASGFLLKDSPPDELMRAVRVVAAGASLLSPSVTRRVVEHFAGAARRPAEPHPQLRTLTDREREIIAWVASGRSNDEIAQCLVVSPATVRTHVSRAMVKLGARDRAQLVVFAVRSGLRIPD